MKEIEHDAEFIVVEEVNDYTDKIANERLTCAKVDAEKLEHEAHANRDSASRNNALAALACDRVISSMCIRIIDIRA